MGRRPPRPALLTRGAAIGVLGAAIAAALPLLGAPAGPAAGAAARSWVIESFEAEITVLKSGEIAVTETIRPRFEGRWNGIYRDIPIDYRTPAGFGYRLRLSVEEVTDGAGNPLRHELSRHRQNRRIKVWIPGARDVTRTVVIRYRVENALRFFDADEERDGIVEAYDELYWNVTGDEWPVPIEAARATVILPAEVTGIRSNAFTGAFGSRESAADIERVGSRISFTAQRELAFREGLTIGVAWNPGVVRRPTAVDRSISFLTANWPLILPLLALIGMYRLWSTRGRDPEIGSVSPRYEPPDGLAPAEVGVVADDRADMRDVTATIVDLAVRGFLLIEEVEEAKLFGLLSDKEYEFHLRKPREEWEDVHPYERKLLNALFSGRGDRVRLSELENEFYKDLPGIKDALMDRLLKLEVYRHRPDHVRGRWIVGGLACGAALAGFGVLLAERLGLAPQAAVVAGVLSGGIVAGFGLVMPARTLEGARLLRLVRGFEEFLQRVESDRMRRMITGPEMFEKFLPFAMALGVEGQWARAFEGIYREPPDWYRGARYDTFRPHLLVSNLGRMSTQTASAMTSAPRSSGGSSFGGGGGGFSGGGFGGGGGGAF